MPTIPSITLTQLDSLWAKVDTMAKITILNEYAAKHMDEFDLSDEEEDLAGDWTHGDEALDDTSTDDEDYHMQVIGYTNQGLPITYQPLPEDEEERDDDPFTWSHQRMYDYRRWVECENDLREQQGLPLYSRWPGHNGHPVLMTEEHFINSATGEEEFRYENEQ